MYSLLKKINFDFEDFIIIMLLCIVFLSTFSFHKNKQKLKWLICENNGLNQQIELLQNQINSHDLLPKEFIRESRINMIKLYINSKYPRIPNSIIDDIAVNIVDISKKEKISYILIMGIIEVESHFNPMAVSKVNARGLMQVMPEWVKKFDSLNNVYDLFNIDTNILHGIKVLKIHLEENDGNLDKALYDYSGKSRVYTTKVYTSIGKFITHQQIKIMDEYASIN